MMPGPLLATTVSESAIRGIRVGPLLIVGHGILELALLLALLLGLEPFLRRPNVIGLIAVAGSAILLWMAAGMFRSLKSISLSLEGDAPAGRCLITTGALVSLANPYWTIWWATIGLGYILHCKRFGAWGIFSFFSGHILADLAFYAAVSVAVVRGRRFLTDPIYRGMIGTCAALLVVFACYFGYSGLRDLAGSSMLATAGNVVVTR